MSDGILTRQEEERLRTFRDNLALENNSADSKTLATLDRASSDRLIMEARLAAISVHDGDQHLQDLSAAIRQAETQGYEPTITAGQYELMKPPAHETTTPRATYQVEKKLRTEGTATKAKDPRRDGDTPDESAALPRPEIYRRELLIIHQMFPAAISAAASQRRVPAAGFRARPTPVPRVKTTRATKKRPTWAETFVQRRNISDHPSPTKGEIPQAMPQG